MLEQLIQRNFYDETQNLQGALWQAAAALRNRVPQDEPPIPPPVIMQLRRGYAESPAWMMVQAMEFEPEPLSVNRFRVRAVYASERIAAALLELLATEGWLDYRGHGDYVLTSAGQQVTQRMRQRTVEWLASLDTHLTDLAGLEQLWERIITSCMASEADGPWCLRYSRRRAPDDSAAAAIKLNQYCADFNAFRDDVHMASYRPYKISGHTWELFWYIWQEQANTIEALHEALLHRGFSRQEDEAAIRELQGREWIAAADDGTLSVTHQGRAIRKTTEQQTNERFYAPFTCLSQTELDDCLGRMERLQVELAQLAAS